MENFIETAEAELRRINRDQDREIRKLQNRVKKLQRIIEARKAGGEMRVAKIPVKSIGELGWAKASDSKNN